MSDPLNNEAVINLLIELGIDTTFSSPGLVSLSGANSRYLKELKLNLAAVLGSANLKKKDALLLALSIAINEKNNILINSFEELSRKEGATTEEIGETHACTSLMNVNNVVYRFRHFMSGNEYYNNHPLGLRMGLMLNPVMGKPLFELMSLVISAVNGCEKCVTAHERSVKEQNVSEAGIYDAIRLGAVVKGLCTVM